MIFGVNRTCPQWIWHDQFGNPTKKSNVPALTQKLLEQGVIHEEEYMHGLHFVAVESTTAAEAHAQTRALMRNGADLMYQNEIHYESIDIKKAGLEWKKEKIVSDCV